MKHWGALIGFIAVLIAIGVAAFVASRFIRGPYRENVLRQSFFCDWVYSYAIIIGLSVIVLFVTEGGLRAQWESMAALVAMFGGVGGLGLWISLKHQVVVAEFGLEISHVLQPRRHLAWTEITHIRCGFFGIRIDSTRYHKSVWVSDHLDNIHYLLNEAEARHILISGFLADH